MPLACSTTTARYHWSSPVKSAATVEPRFGRNAASGTNDAAFWSLSRACIQSAFSASDARRAKKREPLTTSVTSNVARSETSLTRAVSSEDTARSAFVAAVFKAASASGDQSRHIPTRARRAASIRDVSFAPFARDSARKDGCRLPSPSLKSHSPSSTLFPLVSSTKNRFPRNVPALSTASTSISTSRCMAWRRAKASAAAASFA